MTIFRRFLVLAVLLFWQGGFVFFAAVVVPIGREELGPRSKQTVITNRVTYYINLAGAVSIAPLLWDVVLPDPSARRRWVRGVLWVILLVTLLAQTYLYREMYGMLDAILTGIEPPAFRQTHWTYLAVSAVQVVAGLLYVAATLMTWRGQDCGPATPQAAG